MNITGAGGFKFSSITMTIAYFMTIFISLIVIGLLVFDC